MLTLGFVAMLVDSPSGEELKQVEQDPYMFLELSPPRTKPVDSPHKNGSDSVSQLNIFFALTHVHIFRTLCSFDFLFASSTISTPSTPFPIRLWALQRLRHPPRLHPVLIQGPRRAPMVGRKFIGLEVVGLFSLMSFWQYLHVGNTMGWQTLFIIALLRLRWSEWLVGLNLIRKSLSSGEANSEGCANPNVCQVISRFQPIFSKNTRPKARPGINFSSCISKLMGTRTGL